MSATDTFQNQSSKIVSSSGQAANMSLSLLCIPLQLMVKIHLMILQSTNIHCMSPLGNLLAKALCTEIFLLYTAHHISNGSCASEQPKHACQATFYSLNSLNERHPFRFWSITWTFSWKQPHTRLCLTEHLQLQPEVTQLRCTTSPPGAGKEGAAGHVLQQDMERKLLW